MLQHGRDEKHRKFLFNRYHPGVLLYPLVISKVILEGNVPKLHAVALN